MALSSSFASPMIIPKIHCRRVMHKHQYKTGPDTWLSLSPQRFGTKLYGHHKLGSEVKHDWCFLRGGPKVEKCIFSRKSSGVCHSCKPSPTHIKIWYHRTALAFAAISLEFSDGNSSFGFGVISGLSNSQIASSVFTLGTAAVLPFYTLMVAAPKAELTKKTMRSSLPYVGLGLLYAYLLWLSWTPDTIGLMFASKYWLPELQGIAKMFSNETTLASAWIHLLVVDLFAARQVYQDGLENEVETRHSVSLCLLFCPIGIISHAITKRLTNNPKNTKHNDRLI